MEEMKKEPAANSEYVLEVKNLVKWFPIKSGIIKKTIGNVKAVDGVSTPPLGFAPEQEIINS